MAKSRAHVNALHNVKVGNFNRQSGEMSAVLDGQAVVEDGNGGHQASCPQASYGVVPA